MSSLKSIVIGVTASSIGLVYALPLQAPALPSYHSQTSVDLAARGYVPCYGAMLCLPSLLGDEPAVVNPAEGNSISPYATRAITLPPYVECFGAMLCNPSLYDIPSTVDSNSAKRELALKGTSVWVPCLAAMVCYEGLFESSVESTSAKREVIPTADGAILATRSPVLCIGKVCAPFVGGEEPSSRESIEGNNDSQNPKREIIISRTDAGLTTRDFLPCFAAMLCEPSLYADYEGI